MPEVEPGEAVALMVHTLGDDPFELIQQLEEAGRVKAKAAGTLVQMDKLKDTLHAKLRAEYARGFAQEKKKIVEAQLDRLAYADDRYRAHINGLAAATEAKEDADAAYWTIRAKLEWLRAALAHYNALTRLDEGN